MHKIAFVFLTVGLVGVALGIGGLFEDACVKLYDKFDKAMEKLLDKALGV